MTNLLLLYIIGVAGLGTIGLITAVKKKKGAGVPPAGIAIFSCIVLLPALLFYQNAGISSIVHLPGWQLPFAKMTLECDSLSLLFLIPLLILAICSSLFGPRYMAGHHSNRTHWLFFSLLIAGMVLVLVARNAVLFIISWEIMSLASFFLVISDTENESSVKAGRIYFVTAHIGTAFLLALFFMLSSTSGSFDFDAWKPARFSLHQANTIFILAVTAFGFKAGFIPFHIWLPLAHPAAPSHVSSIMSGIMIKMGIYGILRMLTFISPFQAWWGIFFIFAGGFSAILGILFAMGQKEIKRLLAYSSVENIGIIIMGIGLGMTGVYYNSAMVALFGFTGAFFHIVNHSLFKSMLFLGAGAVINQTGTGEIDRLGGLIKSMPKTANAFLLGTLGICGLPFLNGFIGELFIYAGSISGALHATQPAPALLSLSVVVMLGLTGGLAIACFTKFFGIIFLGEPRHGAAGNSGETPAPMLAGIWIPAILCIIIGLCSRFILPFIIHPVLQFLPFDSDAETKSLFSLSTVTGITLFSCGLLMLVTAGISSFVNRNNKPAGDGITWDCGYVQSDPSIQYTASSFTAPVVDFFHKSIAAKTALTDSRELFPPPVWSFRASVDDWFLSKIFSPAAQTLFRFFSRLQWLQSGKTGMYVLYIALTALGIIIWKFIP